MDDRPFIERDRYEWCDVYGKVNPAIGIKAKLPKIIYLGPICGLRLDNPVKLFVMAVSRYMRQRKIMRQNFKDVLSNYLYTYIRRRPITVYERPAKVRKNYVFHSSTLWHSDFARSDINFFRHEFLVACKREGMEVEGGLYYVGESDLVLRMQPDYPQYKESYKDFVYYKRIPMDDYIRKTKESVCVFNTPSVVGCHSWKLTEYLCMGKAIISTPPCRDLPEPFVHGENIHIVKTRKELVKAIHLINNDEAYRHKLEQGARAYYDKWVAPERQISRLISANGNT